MANTYFKFKQFIVHQDLAAMKVGTDGVLLGAWAPTKEITSVLDIGTGTGLIALMIAQRNSSVQIDALEIDETAFQQAEYNFGQSKWKNRLKTIHCSMQKFSQQTNNKYDLIVSNPPYFNNSLKNECDKKSMARHTDSLNYGELITGVNSLLHTNGDFCVVLPASEKEIFTSLAINNGLHLNKILNIKPTPTKPVKRVLMKYSFIKKSIIEESMIIEEFGRHAYSEAYKKLTRDFYLAF